MRIATQQITIARDPMTIVSKDVWPWEVPVLQEKYGGKVEVYGETTAERDAIHDPELEYRRMAVIHGSEPQRGVTYVEMTYGRGRAGIAELEKEILKASGKKAAKKVKAKKAAVEPPADKDEPEDPLG